MDLDAFAFLDVVLLSPSGLDVNFWNGAGHSDELLQSSPVRLTSQPPVFQRVDGLA